MNYKIIHQNIKLRDMMLTTNPIIKSFNLNKLQHTIQNKRKK